LFTGVDESGASDDWVPSPGRVVAVATGPDGVLGRALHNGSEQREPRQRNNGHHGNCAEQPSPDSFGNEGCLHEGGLGGCRWEPLLIRLDRKGERARVRAPLPVQRLESQANKTFRAGFDTGRRRIEVTVESLRRVDEVQSAAGLFVAMVLDQEIERRPSIAA
jgi:hypothetical protein